MKIKNHLRELKNSVYDNYKSIPNSWHKDSIVSFKVTPPDSTNAYNLFVNLRNTTTYKYNNLFLIVEMVFPHGKTIKDTLEYKMAEPNGKLLGEGYMDIKENKLFWTDENYKILDGSHRLAAYSELYFYYGYDFPFDGDLKIYKRIKN